ncbi:polyribonucleotide nucleotidyltransferase [Candidatus Jorgensenbacteria bacterium CG11_big_fil_rev_8_21_14_0_20_38_23]|uniref:Polyribonucleotide nucleotidyltransferase n=1 Tax=Candidatus Jorgensenbacteria bacterium CG11_big_fil_rev_8_21_14_0_20_38_23 TaxID=1974594 RepID=A0A2H0NCL2_9BACT|nr:MAG: polyribonucleotide nucleotidyltransferase [Candidatus Jorgensenbacteria bacterium CG11_big_fil_rev_8_21_14_0_20_38_23]
MDIKRKIFKTGLQGEEISLEISDLAHQANAAVIGCAGQTAVLATVVMGHEDVNLDYFPLVVDYEERFYAAGKIIGSRFIRREGRPSDEAILSGRLIDRTIRPFFDNRLRREVQIVVTVLAYDEKNDPDTIALLAASTALAISDIPWNGPVAGVKMTLPGEKGVGFFSGTNKKINMIEFEGQEASEEEVADIFQKAQEEIQKLIDFQKKIIQSEGKIKAAVCSKEPDIRIKKMVQEFVKPDLEKILYQDSKKQDKNLNLEEFKNSLFQHLIESGENAQSLNQAKDFFEEEIEHLVHKNILEKEKRPDGRKLDEVRDLYAEVGLFQKTHGSALFIRGDTQVLAITTLASPSAEQLVETMETSGHKRFMLHYNFPNFSVGETGRSRGPGRREIGHGALTAKALNYLIPSKDDFPYTIRVVAETLSSNGSSSMASVCASSLSLMDAGVPIKKPAVGISLGLMTDEKRENYKILTDIQGPEDHYGDMDLKIAGTIDGITAIQMDTKIDGINQEIFGKSLKQSKKAWRQILEFMNKVLAKPRPQISPSAPTILVLKVPVEKIGEIIGPGGRTIKGIIAAAGKEITIDTDQSGKVFVGGQDKTAVNRAYEMVKSIIKEYQVGEIVEGKVIKILEFGAIVDLGGGKDGMIHISELANGYTKKVEDIVKLGETVKAKIIRVEPDGHIALSLK